MTNDNQHDITPLQFKKMLQEQGKSMVDLAKEIGVNYRTVHAVLNGLNKGLRGEAYRVVIALGLKDVSCGTGYYKNSKHTKEPNEADRTRALEIKVRFLREGKTFTALAKEFDCSRQLISQVLRGESMASFGKVHAIAIALGMKEAD